eukprot:jgi/Tetstr1/420626/TSEL_011714.t1
MEVDNVAGNRNDLGSNGEEEPVPGGPVVAAHAGAMGEPDRAGRLLDDNFWEDNELQEGEPAGFLSSLNGSDDDTTDEEPAEEEDEEQEGEQRQQPEAATQEGGAEEVGNGTRDPDDDRELPECFSHELIGKPPKNSSIGGVLVDLLGVKADYELPTAAYEEILYFLNTALGNDRFPKTEPASLKALGIDSDISRFERHWCRSCGQYVYPPPADIDMMSDPEHSFSTQEGRWRLHDSADELGVASCMECEAPRFVQVRKNRKIILEPDGIYFDFGIIEILWRMLRRPDSAANQPYRQDLSKNAFLNSDFGRQLKEATDGAIADAANLIMDVGIDGVQLTTFKHHSATVYVSRVANVPRYKLTGRGYHAAFFACMWCLFQGIHLDGAVRFLGYFAAAAQTLWHQAFNPILPPGNGVRDTRARQEGEAQKRCITEVLRDPGRQCVQSCFAGADGSMLTDTELEALQRASAAGKLPKGLTGSAHVHAAYDILGATFSIVNSHALPLHHALLLGVVKTFLLRMGEVQIYDQRVKNIKVTNDFGRPPIIIMGGSSMLPNWTAESFQDFILTYSHSAMDDLLKKLPKHWHTAFMCLAAVCRHYLKADAAVYAKPGETEASLLGRILETDNAIDNRRLDGAANLIRFAKICEHLCGDFRLMCSNLHVLVCMLAAQEKARGCTAREVEMFLERGVRYFRKVIVGKCSKDPERAFAVEVMKQMRLEDFELLYNGMVTSMRRDRGSMSTTAKKAHAALGAVGGAVSKARVQEEFCEEGVDVHAHTVALFKTYVEEFGPDGLKVQDIREDTTNIEMTYYGRMEALKPDHESYPVYCSRAYNRLPKGNAWVLTAQRWENWGAGLVPVDFYIRQTTEQRKDLAFMPTGSAEAENQDMFQEILQVEVSYFVVAERHRKDNALAAPPVVFAVGDAHRGSRVPSAPISTGLWEGPINTVFQQDFVFPPSIVHGRLVTYTWTEAINTAGRGRRQRAAADAAPRQMIRWCSYVKHSHAKDIAALDEDDGGVDAGQ